jgi:hypothetical protein
MRRFRALVTKALGGERTLSSERLYELLAAVDRDGYMRGYRAMALKVRMENGVTPWLYRGRLKGAA